jgi:hypothetical protein
MYLSKKKPKIFALSKPDGTWHSSPARVSHSLSLLIERMIEKQWENKVPKIATAAVVNVGVAHENEIASKRGRKHFTESNSD